MKTVTRLVRTFTPEHYDLSITLYRSERRFTGTVSINGHTTAGVSTISLHAQDLVIGKVLVDGKQATTTAHPHDELHIHHPDITEGKHIVVVEFSGTITDSMNGIYPCYFELEGTKHELLATQFESHFARQAFPCVDEPEAKATFAVTLQTEQAVTVLGNMPIKTQRVENGWLLTQFETTPRMSSYLVAWVVGELNKKTAVTKRGVEVSVWATPAQPPESLDFALDIATRSIDFFETYFGVPYPLPKSDHVALPDFSAGAMENWGLITYREIALLVDPAISTLAMRQHAALTIAHELSHQWFGNLVTMQWWNDLWLNESFANIMEYVAIDALEPNWNIWLEQANGEVVSALRRDSLDGVQPIQIDVHHPDEISTIFDPSIVYAKGGRLLRMLQAFIGDEALRAGLKQYFEAHAYHNTTADDLWAALSKASGKEITSLMHSWITQPGFPVINASRDTVAGTITLTQSQFFVGPHRDMQRVWPIPLHATIPEVPTMLASRSTQFAYASSAVFRLNIDSTAHFITKYDPLLFEAITGVLPSLSTVDRLSFLHEQTLLAKGQLQSNAALIPLLMHYAEETNEAVWSIISLAISELRQFVETDSASEEKLKALVRKLVAYNYERLGWSQKKDEPENDTKLRSTIISLALYSERPDALAEAKRHYTTTPVESLDNELRTAILVNTVRHNATKTVVNDLLRIYKQTTNSELREDIAAALTATRSVPVVRKLSKLLQDTTYIRPQDFTHWYVWLLRNRYARAFMWQWTQNEWQWIETTFKQDASYDMLPRYIAGSLRTTTEQEEYLQFFEPKKRQPALKRNIVIGSTELEGRVQLLAKDGPVVREALLHLRNLE